MATRNIRADEVTDLDHIFANDGRSSVIRAYEAQGIIVIQTTRGVYNYHADDPVCVLRAG